MGIKFDRAIKLMDGVSTPVTIQANGVVVAEATSLEIINSSSSKSTEGILNVHFEKQNLPKGVTYQLCLPEGVIGWTELEEGIYQLVNGAIRTSFSVPSTLGPTYGTTGGQELYDSNDFIVFFWKFDVKAVGQPKFNLYRENEKIAEIPAEIAGDWGLDSAQPAFEEYMTFDKGVNYKLVLPAGSACSIYREDIVNDEIVLNFIGGYNGNEDSFVYDWCSLFTEYSGILGEVSFRFARPIEIAADAKVILREIYPTAQVIMEVTPRLDTDANCWFLVCDFGGYTRDDEWGFTIDIPEGTVTSQGVKNAHCDVTIQCGGIEVITEDSEFAHPYYNLQGIIVDNPKGGNIYIRNGKKIIYK
ncbi:MAG: hypothetical protein K2L84_03105 [Muribaculaceae bacterium]|nr:hypothetical protein [Muribaculaceae bacterium]